MRQTNRAEDLNVRLYATGKSKRWAATKLRVSREWLTKVLNSNADSPSLLDKVEALIDELESDKYQMAATA